MLHGKNNRFFFLWEQMVFIMQNISLFLPCNMAAVQNLYTSCITKLQVISRRGGVYPLHLPPRSALDSHHCANGLIRDNLACSLSVFICWLLLYGSMVALYGGLLFDIVADSIILSLSYLLNDFCLVIRFLNRGLVFKILDKL